MFDTGIFPRILISTTRKTGMEFISSKQLKRGLDMSVPFSSRSSSRTFITISDFVDETCLQAMTTFFPHHMTQ